MKEYSYNASSDAENVSSVIFELVGRGKKVLEVGCSIGSQTRALVEELGCEVTGVEIDPAAAEKAKEHCKRVVVGSFESPEILSKLGGERFDIVLFADVLEHLYDPRGALVRAKSLLSDAGEVVASVPNIAHASIVWELAHGRFNYQRFGLLDDSHIRFFTKRTLEDMFEAAGFRTIEWRRFLLGAEVAGFPIIPSGDKDAEFLTYIASNNHEYQTYQFVVRAAPSLLADAALERRLSVLADEKDALERKLTNAEEAMRKLKSNIEWIQANSVPIRIKNALSRIFSR